MIVASLAVTILLLKTYAVVSMRVGSWVAGGLGSGSSAAANAPGGQGLRMVSVTEDEI